MRRTRVAVVVGTRPEGIKMAPVIGALRARNDRFDTTVVATGQHRELLAGALQAFHIRPDIDLDVMSHCQQLAPLMGRLLAELAAVWTRLAPDVVLVQGDTASTLAGALSAFYAGVPVGHVEAGLRTGDVHAPFPEELHRRVVDSVSSYCFAPTDASRRHLLAEGVREACIHVTGNTGIDALLLTAARLRDAAAPDGLDPSLFDGAPLVVVTAHRRESFGAGLAGICDALIMLTEARPDVRMLVAVHPNPHVREAMLARLAGHRRLHLTPPLDYQAFVYTLMRAALILTDSGGIQEEAPSLGVPVVVLRSVTDRPEAGDDAVLAGTSGPAIVEAALRALTRMAPARGDNPFGDGQASQRIVRALLEATPDLDREGSFRPL